MSVIGTRWIRPHVIFTWEGSEVRILKVGRNVLVATRNGSKSFELPIAAVAGALRDELAPEDAPALHDVEERLSEGARQRLAEDEDLLHMMRTGRHIDQLESDRTAPGLDPQHTMPGERRRRLATHLAQTPRSKGRSKGHTVLVKSEMRRLQRLEKKVEERNSVLHASYGKLHTWRTPAEVMEALHAFLESHALKSAMSDAALVRAFRIHCLRSNLELALPSDTTLRRRINDIRTGYARLRSTPKNRGSQSRVPTASWRIRSATRPGELVLFDTTKSNILVRDPKTQRTHRLDVTVALDLATRCIVGLAVTHSTPALAIGLCLSDILRPKASTLTLAPPATGDDEKGEIPFIGRPASVEPFASNAFHPEGAVVDNGKPYVSRYVLEQMRQFGISYEPQRSYTPTDKAQVERAFRTLKDLFEMQMPGFVGGSVHERGEGAEGGPLMTPNDYEALLRQCIELYNVRPHKGLVLPEDPNEQLSPLRMYDILIERTGSIPDVSYEHAWVRFLPSEARKPSGGRVRIQRLEFRSPVLRELESDLNVRATGKVRVYYDPYDLRITWCFAADGTLHALPWRHIDLVRERFGQFHTNWVARQFKHRKLSDRDFEELLVRVFAESLDAMPSVIESPSAAGDLLRLGIGALIEDELKSAIGVSPSSEPGTRNPSSESPVVDVIRDGQVQTEVEPVEVPPDQQPRRRIAVQVYGRRAS